MVQSGNSYRPSNLDYSKPIYDPNYKDNITGYQQSSQFYQPIFQPQYNNYANPLTAGSVAAYGTNPGPSSGYLAATAQGGQGLDNYYQGLRAFGAQQSSQPYGMDYTTFNPARKQLGANQADLMSAYQYNPQQQQQQFNGGYGGGFGGQQQNYGGGYGGGFMPQMQTPFNPYMNQYQSPFSYQQPMQQAQPNYGPSQPIYSRSTQGRGTPNMRRYAEGGIASLMDDVE
jgi:hypothetical protein